MNRPDLRLSLTTAALLTALAACGGSADSTDSNAAAKSLPGTENASALTPKDVQPAASESAVTRDPAAAAATQASQPREGTAASAPISNDSVRGDVLLTMLDQKACAMAVLASGLDGPRADKAVSDQYPEIKTDVILEPSNYVRRPDAPTWPSSWMFDASCSSTHTAYQPVAAGKHTINEYSTPYYYNNTSMTQRRFNYWTAKVPLEVTADGFSVGAQIQVSARFDPAKPGGGQIDNVPAPVESALSTDKPFSAKLTSEVPYGTLVQWADAAGHNDQLMLLKGNEGVAKLCWNGNTPHVRRLHCTAWSVPQNWKRGDKLNFVDQYVVEDRAPYAGESGLIHYSAKAYAGTEAK